MHAPERDRDPDVEAGRSASQGRKVAMLGAGRNDEAVVAVAAGLPERGVDEIGDQVELACRNP